MASISAGSNDTSQDQRPSPQATPCSRITARKGTHRGSPKSHQQRVALKLEGNEQLVVKTGLYNLTNDEVPVLLHMGAGRQEARTFIRPHQPQEEQ